MGEEKSKRKLSQKLLEQKKKETQEKTEHSKSVLILATDTLDDAAFSLNMVNDCLVKVKQEPLYWKWALIALHNALQGFMVNSLCLSNSAPVIKAAPKKRCECPTCGQWIAAVGEKNWGSLEEWAEWDRDPDNTPPPKPPRLLEFMQLYGRIKQPLYMERLDGSKAFKPSGTQTASVKRLNNVWRNNFIHFIPKTWLQLATDFLPVVRDVISIISFLAFDSQNILWEHRAYLGEKTKDLIKSILQTTDALKKDYKMPKRG